MSVPWRDDRRTREFFPGVPAWGRPTSHAAPPAFPAIAAEGAVTPDWAWGGADGSGVRVCVVDSGVAGDHPMVGPVDRAVAVTLAPDGTHSVADVESSDAAGHGTACAGIIRSLAPAASISSARVLTEGITGTGAALLAGLEWAIGEGYDIVNLSLSTTKNALRQRLYELADRAYFQRTAIIVSAHNMPVPSYPWPFASVISVASHDEQDAELHYYNPAPPVEFFARGMAVPVALPGGGQMRATGNSYAAPHISGRCCLILSKHRWLTPFQLKSVLYLTARNVAETGGTANDERA
jgi:subtilisin family serine protease